jgi:hypothetical protein
MQDFDWVTARANCLPATVFETLRLQVKSDIEKRKGLLKEQRDAFKMVEDDTRFSVRIPSDPLRGNVIFELSGERIVVYRKNNVLCEAMKSGLK